MQTIEFTGVNDLLNAVSGAIADRDARIATLEALLAERTPADPALLALARFGALVVRDYFRVEGFIRVRGPLLDSDAAFSGVTTDGEHYPVFAPGIADAIAALLTPDGAASEVTDA